MASSSRSALGRAELGLVYLHPPSVPFIRTFCERLGNRPDTVVPTFQPHRQHGRSQQVVLFGMAGGASGGVMLISW
ncbi:hypothetical protein [Streptomyces katrae]|uniref:hypothetical protein n=1 Tax=Streptomyces katrae TaxID=68223 RepID=UPI0004BE97AC|nr:hypothetical protein [Streptomyces katrae]